jgi:hypothetical protein
VSLAANVGVSALSSDTSLLESPLLRQFLDNPGLEISAVLESVADQAQLFVFG